ncbi:hypothetical protein [Spirosoma litoris]
MQRPTVLPNWSRMPLSYSSFADASQRRWWLMVTLLVLVAGLLIGGVWLYYAKQVQQLDQQLHQLPDSSAVPVLNKPS